MSLLLTAAITATVITIIITIIVIIIDAYTAVTIKFIDRKRFCPPPRVLPRSIKLDYVKQPVLQENRLVSPL